MSEEDRMDVQATEGTTKYVDKFNDKKHLPNNTAEQVLNGEASAIKFKWDPLAIECPVKQEKAKEQPQEKPGATTDHDDQPGESGQILTLSKVTTTITFTAFFDDSILGKDKTIYLEKEPGKNKGDPATYSFTQAKPTTGKEGTDFVAIDWDAVMQHVELHIARILEIAKTLFKGITTPQKQFCGGELANEAAWKGAQEKDVVKAIASAIRDAITLASGASEEQEVRKTQFDKLKK